MLLGCGGQLRFADDMGDRAGSATGRLEPVAQHTTSNSVYCPETVSLDEPPLFTPSSVLPGDAYAYGGAATFKPPKTMADLILLRTWYRVYAWQAFAALNWPLLPDGSVQKDLAGSGPPQWTSWRENYELYSRKHSYTRSWSNPRHLFQRKNLPPVGQIPATDMEDRGVRVLFDVQPAGSEPGDQPEDQILWDQSGDPVFYEVVLNRTVFDFTVQNGLYTRDGQITYYKRMGDVIAHGGFFKYGSCTTQSALGAVSLKLAWKVLRASDDPTRYVTMRAWVPSADNSTWTPVQVGLVGMHIAHKTLSSNQRWLWSTFEQVDNVRVDDADVLEYAKAGKRLVPSFTDLTCVTCPVNVPPEPVDGGRRTQVHRTVAIPDSLEKLNDDIQQILRRSAPRSPLRYYELIGVQFTTDSNEDPAPATEGLPESITNKGGGRPDPTYLTNSAMETYQQLGNQRLEEQVTKAPESEKNTIVFGTQSCMGCHVDAALKGMDDQDRTVWLPGFADYHFQFGNALMSD